MNDFFRGIEIERQADGWWLKLEGVYRFEAYPTIEAARNRVNAYLRALMLAAWRDA